MILTHYTLTQANSQQQLQSILPNWDQTSQPGSIRESDNSGGGDPG